MSDIRTVIVDDDPAVIRLHTAYVGELDGFSLVGTARTGAGGAQLAASTDVDLVLLDMNLPDFSGIEVLHRLRILRDWDVDVMVISSARDAFTVRQALSAHVVGYLVKPFTKQAFHSRLTAYRRARGARGTEALVPLGQGAIDALVQGRTPAETTRSGPPPVTTSPRPLPKGLSESTMTLLLAALDPVRSSSVKDLAAASGASVPTVRRYLEHLVREGAVSVSHRFGQRGRPEVLYRRAVA